MAKIGMGTVGCVVMVVLVGQFVLLQLLLGGGGGGKAAAPVVPEKLKLVNLYPDRRILYKVNTTTLKPKKSRDTYPDDSCAFTSASSDESASDALVELAVIAARSSANCLSASTFAS